MKVLIYKSISLGDIYFGHHIGIWQTGSNDKSGPVGYNNPPGSVVLIRCQENGKWYVMGVSASYPRKIVGKVQRWPSFEDMAKEKDYVAEVLFCPVPNHPKVFDESNIQEILNNDLSKFKIGGVLDVEPSVVEVLLLS